MRNIFLALAAVLLLFAGVHSALARGGQNADDCPPGTTDPDCMGTSGR